MAYKNWNKGYIYIVIEDLPIKNTLFIWWRVFKTQSAQKCFKGLIFMFGKDSKFLLWYEMDMFVSPQEGVWRKEIVSTSH